MGLRFTRLPKIQPRQPVHNRHRLDADLYHTLDQMRDILLVLAVSIRVGRDATALIGFDPILIDHPI